MFGRKKKESKPSIFLESIKHSIESDIVNEEPAQRESDDTPYLPTGVFNTVIYSEYLNSLPVHMKSRWHRIDFEKLYAEPEEPESPDTNLSRISRASEIPIDLFKLNQEQKDKLRAIALGELPKGEEE